MLVVVRSHAQLAACVAACPYPVDDPKALHVTFLATPPSVDSLARLDRACEAPDEHTVIGRELYLHLLRGAGRSKLAMAVSTLRDDPRATTRNWNTVTKLLALCAEHDR